MTPPLPLSDPEYSHLSKLHWAGRNAEQLITEAEAFMATATRAVAILRDDEATDLVFLAASQDPQVPWDWHERVYNVIGSLRAALELLATALARSANGGQPLGAAAAKDITFPIYTSRHSFRSREGSIKRYFRPADWERIEQLQPYNATDVRIWGQGVGSYTPHCCPIFLAVIDKLAKTGRHQVLSPVGFAISMFRAPAEVNGCRVTGSSDVVDFLRPGQEFGRWHFELLPDGLPTPEQMQQYMQLRLHLAQEYYDYRDQPDCDWEITPMPDALTFLNACMVWVSKVLYVFRPSVREGKAPLPWTAVAEGG